MQILPIKTRLFRENESLSDFIFEHVGNIGDGHVLVVTSKIMALSQGRTSNKVGNKKKLAESEAEKVVNGKYGTLTLIDGRWCVNAGIDESNASNKLILLPKNVETETVNLYQLLKNHFKINNFGLIITDSRSLPLREGVLSSTYASTGIKQLRSYIGQKDLSGREIKRTQLNVVDALAAAAGLEMGEGDERVPLAIIKGAPIEFTSENTPSIDLCIPPEDDIYADIYRSRRFKIFHFRDTLQKLWNRKNHQ